MDRTRLLGWLLGDDRRTSVLSEDKVARLGDNSQAAVVGRVADDGRGHEDEDGYANVVTDVDEDAWRTGRPARKAKDAAAWWAPLDCSRPGQDFVSSIWFVDSGTRSSPGSPSTRATEPDSVSRKPTGISWF